MTERWRERYKEREGVRRDGAKEKLEGTVEVMGNEKENEGRGEKR